MKIKRTMNGSDVSETVFKQAVISDKRVLGIIERARRRIEQGQEASNAGE